MAVIDPIRCTLAGGEQATVRCADPCDALALLEISRSVMAEGDCTITEPDEFHLDEEQEREWIRGHNEHAGRLLLVAEVAGGPAGFVAFACCDRRRLAHWGELGISIDARWRDRGVGRALINSLLDWAENTPAIEQVRLGVVADNARAIHLYSVLGFTVEGRRERAVRRGNDFYDMVLMVRSVR